MTAMLLEWLATSVFLILVVLALRGLLKKRISAGLRYALWAVVLVRLLVPVQLFTSPVAGTRVFSEVRVEQTVYGSEDIPGGAGSGSGQLQQGSPAQSGGAVQAGQALTLPGGVPDPPQAPTVPEAPAAPKPTDALLAALGWTWLAGSAAMALVFLASNLRFARRLRRVRIPMDGADCPLRAYAAVGLDSPCLFGLIRPAVYVTPEAAADPEMLRHVLAHEATHRRHLDHVWNVLRCAALAVHWWDPLVWLAVALSRRDGELACDEGALKLLGDGERKAYGRTLLALVTAKPRPSDLLCCATTMAGDKKSLMERVSRIAKAPRRLLWAAVAAVLILTLACACAFGRAAEPDPKGDQHHQSEHLGPSMDVEAVPGEVLDAALDHAESMYEDFLRHLETRQPHVDVEFDDWRVERLEGPWTRTAQGTEIGVWRLGCTVHTPAPEQAKVLLAGGMTLSEDGWMTPTDSATWLIFLKGEDGKWQFGHAMEGSSSAEDQPDSDFFWSRATNGVPGVTDPHFVADMTGIPGDVLSLASFYGEERLAACQAGVWVFNALPDGLVPGPGQIEFDDWRITSLKGPWRETVDGTELEVWRLNCEVHTTQPQRAEQALIGGMYLTEDGWFGPDYPDCTYLVFVREADGGWRYRTAVTVNAWGPDGERSSGEGQAQFWKFIAEEVGTDAPDATVYNLGVQSWTPDLNRNGVREIISLAEFGAPDGVELLIEEDGKVLYRGEAGYAHGGWNAYFLCVMNGEEYLLQYDPTMYGGYCGYHYKLFTLEGGQETVVRENTISFDIDFGGTFHEKLDPDAIADFMDEINGLLAYSVQLVNTDENLRSSFFEEGRLFDKLWWLDLDYTRDPYRTLRENLWDYQAAMEQGAASNSKGASSRYLAVLQGNEPLYSPEHGKRMTLDELCAETGPGYTRASISDFSVLDLDGDGAQEVILGIGDYRQWSIVLHEQDGEVRGYALYIRWLNTYTLKEDGAFDWSRGAFENGWGKLRFTADGYEIEETIWHVDTTYYLGDQAVSQAEYDAAYREQEAVPDAVWYDYTDENMSALLK